MSVAVDVIPSNDVAIASGTSLTSNDLGLVPTAAATLLEVQLVLGGASAPTGITMSWNGVALTQRANTNSGGIYVGIWTLVSPATGSGLSIAINWTNTCSGYAHGMTWSGTDTSTGVYVPDSTTLQGTASGSYSLPINTDTNGATSAVIGTSSGTPVASNQTSLWHDTSEAPNGAGSYALGGSGHNTHTFTGANAGNINLAGVHIIAPGYSSAVALDAVMNAGNGPLANGSAGSGSNGASAYIASAGVSLTSGGMTIASGNFLVQALALGNATSSAPAMTWDSASLTNGPSYLENNASNYVNALLAYLSSPTTGNQTAAGSWAGSNTAVLSCISFTGAAGVWTPHNVASGNQTAGEQTITINTDPNGATIALLVSAGGGAYATDTVNSSANVVNWFVNGLAQQNVCASYALGGTSQNVHKFSGGASNSCVALVGIHIVASGYGGLSASYAPFAITGGNVSFSANTSIPNLLAACGSYNISFASASSDFQFIVSDGSYSYTGIAAALVPVISPVVLTAAFGSYSIAAQTAQLTDLQTVIPGIYSIAGKNVTFSSLLSIVASQGSYFIGGQSAALSTSGTGISVPNCVGLTQAAAIAALQALGFDQILVDLVYVVPVPYGLIAGQYPAANTVVPAGTSVILYESIGPNTKQTTYIQ